MTTEAARASMDWCLPLLPSYSSEPKRSYPPKLKGPANQRASISRLELTRLHNNSHLSGGLLSCCVSHCELVSVVSFLHGRELQDWCSNTLDIEMQTVEKQPPRITTSYTKSCSGLRDLPSFLIYLVLSYYLLEFSKISECWIRCCGTSC